MLLTANRPNHVNIVATENSLRYGCSFRTVYLENCILWKNCLQLLTESDDYCCRPPTAAGHTVCHVPHGTDDWRYSYE